MQTRRYCYVSQDLLPDEFAMYPTQFSKALKTSLLAKGTNESHRHCQSCDLSGKQSKYFFCCANEKVWFWSVNGLDKLLVFGQVKRDDPVM